MLLQFCNRIKRRRCAVDHGYFLARNHVGQLIRVVILERRNHQRSAGTERNKEILLRQIEAECTDQQHAIGVGQLQQVAIPFQQIAFTAMVDTGPFWPAGRTGSVNVIQHILGGRLIRQRLVGTILQRHCQIIQAQNTGFRRQCNTRVLQALHDTGLGHQHWCLAVFQNVTDSIGRIAGIHRYVRRTRFDDTQVKRWQMNTATHADTHPLPGTHAIASEPVRDAVALGIQFAVRLRLLAADNGHLIRLRIDLMRNQIQQRFACMGVLYWALP